MAEIRGKGIKSIYRHWSRAGHGHQISVHAPVALIKSWRIRLLARGPRAPGATAIKKCMPSSGCNLKICRIP